MTDTEYTQFIFNSFEKMTTKAITKSYLGDDIYRYFKTQIQTVCQNKYENVIECSKTVIDYYKINNTVSSEQTQKSIKELYILHLRQSAYIMDCYTLCRIFKKFKTNGFEPEEPTNIVIYSGNFHSEDYRTFLKSIDFIETESASKLKLRCLDISGIKQPFFSDK